jgi:hypothetical protein
MTYADHPMALQLRAMNIIYERSKERGATILIPTSMVDSLNPVVALALAGQDTAKQTNEPTAAGQPPPVTRPVIGWSSRSKDNTATRRCLRPATPNRP